MGPVQKNQSTSALEVEGHCPGLILEAPRGKGGFGYEPIFFAPEVRVLALLRTLALNLLRRNGFRSIRAGLMAVAHDTHRMLGWIGVSPADSG
jgi:hypothetical protein